MVLYLFLWRFILPHFHGPKPVVDGHESKTTVPATVPTGSLDRWRNIKMYMENHEKPWKTMENHGKPWKTYNEDL